MFANCALAMAALTLLSFPVTYFVPIASGQPDPRPGIHIHALAYFAWMALYVRQTQLVASGRTARHRALGLGGLLLSGAMVPLGFVATLAAIHTRIAEKHPTPFANAAFNLIDIALFSLMIGLATAAIPGRLDHHRRYMFAAAISLLGPAMSRLFIPLPQAAPFTWVDPALLADLFFLVLILHDRRTLGRIHPATLTATLLVVGGHLLSLPLSKSGWWQQTAPALLALSPGGG